MGFGTNLPARRVPTWDTDLVGLAVVVVSAYIFPSPRSGTAAKGIK